MIAFKQVSFGIDGRRILDSIDLQVANGETLVLLGRSGSGKTTALRMVNAMRMPSSGQVLVDGTPTSAHNPIALRRRIGYVIQEVGIFPHRTVAANVATVPHLIGWSAGRVERRVNELLEEVGLPPSVFAARYPHQLSGGQRQRVGVARALAAEPQILLFDEPFGALDPITRREMQSLFLSLREKHRLTSVFVTHDLDEAMRLGTRIALLVEGRLDTIGSPEEFRLADTEEARCFLQTLKGASR